MSNVIISIECGNAAFNDAEGYEVARILRKLADRIQEDSPLCGDIPLMDYNGNRVGMFRVVSDSDLAELDEAMGGL